jgi:hypothetical protein
LRQKTVKTVSNHTPKALYNNNTIAPWCKEKGIEMVERDSKT